MAGLATNIGFTVASALGLPTVFGCKNYWPILFYLELIPCLLHLFLLVISVVESPQYFLRKNNEEDARNALSLYSHNKSSIGDELARLKNELICNTETAGWSTLYKDKLDVASYITHQIILFNYLSMVFRSTIINLIV